uniref:Uncharacterized protein n=1 Tax=Sinocyclocheilus rhinocerous TaxID=307959 RepID=A0A673FMK2_9TELE
GNIARREATHLLTERQWKRHASNAKLLEYVCIADCLARIQRYIVTKLGEDWIFLVLLGVTMALVSWSMDYASAKSLQAYKWMHGELKGNVALQYLAWVSYPIILVVFASLFCHLVSPQPVLFLFVLRSLPLHSHLYFGALLTMSNHFCVPLFCHMSSAIMLYIQFLSSFCPQSTLITHNQGRTYPLGKGRRPPWAPKSQGTMSAQTDLRFACKHFSSYYRPVCPAYFCRLNPPLIMNLSVFCMPKSISA